jgi:thioester reductase-like protein
MAYVLLTGATGLVGRHLLRDLLASGRQVAVLARSSKLQSARQRIEAIMAMWENDAKRSLCRPVVLDGDLLSENLGLDASAQQWLTENCDSILHNAASMTFRPDDRGEPFRTNVDGMQRILDMCRATQIREFHHVSTAYLCGLREGRILESELDEGQELGNVYEQSKLAAEKLVRSADCLDRLTVYRPGSVIGDSQTGYCTSLHGFYLPLQLAYSIANIVPPEFMNERFAARLGLRGDEGKNLVPVDWLSAAIVRLFGDPAHHGETYHLASPRPVSVKLIQEVVQEAITKYCDRRPEAVLSDEQLAGVEQLFHDHMLIYRSHWRNDPTFDVTNTQRALPDLPCPEMDRELLLRVSRYPVERKFAVDRYQPTTIRYDMHAHLERWTSVNGNGPADDRTVGLQVNGSGGGQWALGLREGRVLRATPGLGPQETPSFYMNTDTFAALAEGGLSVEDSVNSGRVMIQGTRADEQSYMKILDQIVSGSTVE